MEELSDILNKFKSNEISLEEAEELIRIKILEVEDFAQLDLNRQIRTGIPEIVICEDKTIDQIISIAQGLISAKGRAILSRVDNEKFQAISPQLENSGYELKYEKGAKLCVITASDFVLKRTGGKVGVITAGTSDIPVAEEAKVIAYELGCEVLTAYDVGVAGVHRILPVLENMIKENIDVYIVAAGREGALPTLISGLVDAPVIGVPVSTGYGMAGKGESALYAMLQSCSPLVVVNIDGGTVAGAVAARIANKVANARSK
ncbi:MAG: nickel pincer cofactor biosynthesis protein LarB [Thermoplasmata archaeon]|nr:nickel pincer cofactor biosynthesis protein LarB [Thermoplasmata archaeon]